MRSFPRTRAALLVRIPRLPATVAVATLGLALGTAQTAWPRDSLTACFDAKLTAFDAPTFGGDFGKTAAVSGTTLVIGAPADHQLASQSGAAYVYEKQGESWVFQTKIVPPAGKQFIAGSSVAIDGDTLAIGAPGRMCCGGGVVFDSKGRVFLYERDANGVWQPVSGGGLDGSFGHAKDEFGYSVALSGDRLVVGAPRTVEQSTGHPSGVAYVFERSGGAWTESKRLVPNSVEILTTYRFGYDVAIGHDTNMDGEGDRVAVGAPHESSGAGGYISVFDYTGVTWTEDVVLKASSGQFGTSVAVAGERVAGGAPKLWDSSCKDAGAISIFREFQEVWNLEQKLVPSSNCWDAQLGKYLAMDDARLVASAGPGFSDRFFLYERTGSSWTETDIIPNEPYTQGEIAFDGSVLITRGGDTSARVYQLHQGPHSAWETYGCGVNPSGSLSVLSGHPSVGKPLTLGVTNPYGSQAAGSTPILLLALAPTANHPCGLPLPGTHMAGPGTPGEFLLSPGALLPLQIVGPPWDGTNPAPFAFTLPDTPQLFGLVLYLQGLMHDSAPGANVEYGLTNGLNLTLGHCG